MFDVKDVEFCDKMLEDAGAKMELRKFVRDGIY